jgi:hypothetical protein
MRISAYVSAAVLALFVPTMALAKDTDCRGLKLKKANGFSSGKIHAYEFQGTCSLFDFSGDRRFDHGTQWTRATATWNADTGEFHEEVTTEGQYAGTIVMSLKCAQDPVVTKGVCARVSYNNPTGWSGFDGAWKQNRPITRGKTTLFEAQAVSAMGSVNDAMSPPSPAPGPGGSGGGTGVGPAPAAPGASPSGQGPDNTAPADAPAKKTMKSPSSAGQVKDGQAAPGEGPAHKTMKSLSGSVSVEAEQLISNAQATSGEVGRQNMTTFGSEWGLNSQLFWQVAEQGAQLRLEPTVATSGRYEVFIVFTTAPDYGLFKASLDGKPAVSINGYAAAVGRDRASIGTFDLPAGPHELLLVTRSKDPASTNYFVGIDRIEFKPAP